MEVGSLKLKNKQIFHFIFFCFIIFCSYLFFEFFLFFCHLCLYNLQKNREKYNIEYIYYYGFIIVSPFFLTWLAYYFFICVWWMVVFTTAYFSFCVILHSQTNNNLWINNKPCLFSLLFKLILKIWHGSFNSKAKHWDDFKTKRTAKLMQRTKFKLFLPMFSVFLWLLDIKKDNCDVCFNIVFYSQLSLLDIFFIFLKLVIVGFYNGS